MSNTFRYENDNFKLVPLDLPENCKGTFVSMTNTDFESFKPNSISPFQTFNQNLNINRLNNLNQDTVLNSNFSAAKGLIDTNNNFYGLDVSNNILVKTLIVVKKANELFN